MRLTRVLALCATIAVVPTALQVSPAPLIAPAHAKKEKGAGFAAETFISAAPIATGTVRRFLINAHGDVDGLLLADGTLVKFAPHMGLEVTGAIKLNDPVAIRGYREAGATIKAFVISNEASGQQVVERAPTPALAKMPKHLRFATLSRLWVTGKVERQMRGKKGEVNGVLLDEGTAVRFPPHVAFDLAALLQTGQTVSVEGLGTETAFGRGIEATAIGATPDTVRPIYTQ